MSILLRHFVGLQLAHRCDAELDLYRGIADIE
jgi:hypothetical protein